MVLTRPQVRLPDADIRLKAALQAPLPAGPLAWPSPPDAEESADEESAPATAVKRTESLGRWLWTGDTFASIPPRPWKPTISDSSASFSYWFRQFSDRALYRHAEQRG